MTPTEVHSLVRGATNRLAAAGCDTPLLDAYLLLGYVLGRDRTWLMMNPQHRLTAAQISRFEALLNRRENREPVAYLTGHREFFGLDFWVAPSVLIPRPETELLVETAIEWVTRQNRPVTVADVGTGSGCIAVALAHHLPQARLVAVDISAPALVLARQNAINHRLWPRITFVQADLLRSLSGPLDLVVSNPPYISQTEFDSGLVSPDVRGFEPRLALLGGGRAGEQVIGQLLMQAASRLSARGAVMVEIGAAQAEVALRLAQTYLPNAAVHIKPDLAGLPRLLVAQC